jgi:multidrug resistance efflux pump
MSAQHNASKFKLSWGAVSFIESPSSRVLLFAVSTIFFTLLACIVASFYVNINVTLNAFGEIDSLSGITDAVTVRSGQLYHLQFKEGDSVKKDEVIGWLKIGESNFEQIKSVYEDVNHKVAALNSKNRVDADISVNQISDPEIRANLIEANKFLTALIYTESTWATEARKEISPLKNRLNMLNKQLLYIEKSNVRKFLAMQKAQVEEEKGRLISQITTLENSISTRTYDARAQADNSLRNAVAKLQQYMSDIQIKSPVDGKIARIPSAEGTYLKSGDSIATVIPDGGEMVAKVMVNSKDISKVASKNRVYLEIDAYSSYKFGYFNGEIIGVDLVKAKSSEPHSVSGYVARVRLGDLKPVRQITSISGEQKIQKIVLVPGMKVQARILVRRAPIATLILDKLFGSEL